MSLAVLLVQGCPTLLLPVWGSRPAWHAVARVAEPLIVHGAREVARVRPAVHEEVRGADARLVAQRPEEDAPGHRKYMTYGHSVHRLTYDGYTPSVATLTIAGLRLYLL